MLIRRLTEKDAQAFRELRLRAAREDPQAFSGSYEERAAQPLSASIQLLRANPAAPHTFVLGAFADALVGIVGFERERGAKVQHKGMIWSLYVPREARQRGIGRALLAEAIERARGQPGLRQITLAVVAGNAARRLYESVGFELYGTEPQALCVGGRYLDEDLMILRLE